MNDQFINKMQYLEKITNEHVDTIQRFGKGVNLFKDIYQRGIIDQTAAALFVSMMLNHLKKDFQNYLDQTNRLDSTSTPSGRCLYEAPKSTPSGRRLYEWPESTPDR